MNIRRTIVTVVLGALLFAPGIVTAVPPSTGHFYSGPTSPTGPTQAGDVWVQTGVTEVTGRQPAVQWVRNATNTGWDASGLVLVVGGTVRAVVQLDSADGSITSSVFDAAGGQLAALQVSGSGSIYLVAGASVLSVEADGTIRLNSVNQVVLENLPTADPHVLGALYSDGGTVKVSAG